MKPNHPRFSFILFALLPPKVFCHLLRCLQEIVIGRNRNDERHKIGEKHSSVCMEWQLLEMVLAWQSPQRKPCDQSSGWVVLERNNSYHDGK